MNNRVLPISNLLYTVERPVIYSLIKQVMDITQISNKTNILFLGNESQVAQKGSTIDDQSIGTNIWPFNEKVTIEVEEEIDKARVLNIVTQNPEQPFVFLDEVLNIYAKPVYASAKVTIKVIYRANDENKAKMWLNDMVAKTAMYRDVNTHNVTYSYTLPEIFISIIQEIHKLRENVAPYGEDFITYFINHLTTRANTVSNLNGEKADWVISERQINILGRFDVDGIPEKASKKAESDAYVSEFSYVFSYEKPIELNVVYPTMVHQQEIDEKFIIKPILPHYLNQNNTYSMSGLNFSNFQSDVEILRGYGNKGISIPDHDAGFIPNSIPTATCRVFTALATITENDKYSLFNLNDLGDFVLHKSVLKYIKEHREDVVKIYKSVLNFSLYEDNELMMNNVLSIDEDLNVKSNIELDLRKTYRVRMSIIANLHYLNNSIMKRLREYGYTNRVFLYKIAATINSILKDIGTHKDMRASQLTKDDLIRLGIIRNIYGDSSLMEADDVFYDSEQVHYNLVQNFFISAKSMNELNKNPPKIKYRILEDYIQNENLPESVRLSVEYWLAQYLV